MATPSIITTKLYTKLAIVFAAIFSNVSDHYTKTSDPINLKIEWYVAMTDRYAIAAFIWDKELPVIAIVLCICQSLLMYLQFY